MIEVRRIWGPSKWFCCTYPFIIRISRSGWIKCAGSIVHKPRCYGQMHCFQQFLKNNSEEIPVDFASKTLWQTRKQCTTALTCTLIVACPWCLPRTAPRWFCCAYCWWFWALLMQCLPNFVSSATSTDETNNTGCNRRKGQNFGRVFLMLKYTDITQNTYIKSWTVTEIMAREKCGLLAGLRPVPVSWQVLSMFVLE